MAILKFRAWHIKAKKYFECVGSIEENYFLKVRGDQNSFFAEKKENCIIEQSTGLHDSFGVEIYEGDLVKTYEDSERPYVVVWGKKSGCWGLAMDDETMIPLYTSNLYIVIGNINQHPNIIPHHDPRTTHQPKSSL